MAKNKSVYTRIDPDLHAWIAEQAERARRSISDYIRLVLEDHRANRSQTAKKIQR